MVNKQSPEIQQVAPYSGPGHGGGQIYASSSGGSVIRVQNESVGKGEAAPAAGASRGGGREVGLHRWGGTIRYPSIYICKLRKGQLLA